MSSEYTARILIVDDRREVARVLRTGLEMLDRSFLVRDVPSGEEALLELPRTPFDLIVADYRLPGITGAELIRRARRSNPQVMAIVISGHLTPDVQAELDDLGLAGVFEKPVDIDAFTAAVQAILLGESEAGQEPAPGSEAVLLPDFAQPAIARQISGLLAELGARGMAFVSRAGKVLVKDGVFDESLRLSELAVLLASNFAAAAEVSSYLGDSGSGAVQYYPGSWHDIYALSVSADFFLVIVFPGNSQKQMGPVLRFGRPAVERMQEAIGAPGAEPAGGRPAPTRKTGPLRKTSPLEPAPAAPPTELIPESEEALPAFADLLEESVAAPAIELDFAELDAELEQVGNLDDFWEAAASDEKASGAESISIDEAIELGLIPGDLEE